MAKLPVIGVTTQVIRRAKWYKHIHGLGFDAVEINRRNSKLNFSVFFLEKVKKYMEGFDLSVHSGASGIFQPNESFTAAHLAILSAEIDVCRFLGARQLVFHLGDGVLSKVKKQRLRQVLSRAENLGVDMIYESNSVLVADYAYDALESFPKLGYVLDLGHLNNGYGRGMLGCEIDEFVRNVRNRVVYVHASNNDGWRDEHAGLEEGSLDWRGVLDMLDVSKIVKIIVEVRRRESVDGARRALVQYLITRLSAEKGPNRAPALGRRDPSPAAPKKAQENVAATPP